MSAMNMCKVKIRKQKKQLKIIENNLKTRKEIYDTDKSYINKNRMNSAKTTVNGVKKRLEKLGQELARLERNKPSSGIQVPRIDDPYPK